jgi:hypothetical protein
MIKKIYCFGSSHTEGGGFQNQYLVNHVYKTLIEEPTMSKLSWPGILQNIVGKSTEVINHGKSGSGNERTYRMVTDLIFGENEFNGTKFNKEETLILIEPTNLDRKEYYSNTIKDHVVVNYRTDKPEDTNSFHVVENHYFEKEKGINKKLNKKLYFDFLKEVSRFDIQLSLLQRNLLMFFSFLELHGIKFKIVNGCNIFTDVQQNYKNFKTVKYIFEGKKHYDFTEYAMKHGKLITNETGNTIIDKHQGYFVNRVVSQTINNLLVNENLIKGNIIPVQNTEEDFCKIRNRLNKNLPIM